MESECSLAHSIIDAMSHAEIPVHPYWPSILTQWPLSIAFSHPIMTASSRHPVALTVHTTTSLASANTARSIMYALPSRLRSRMVSAEGAELGVLVASEVDTPRFQNMGAKKPPSQPNVSSTNFRITCLSGFVSWVSTLFASLMRSWARLASANSSDS